jgi:uncharacterized DUF497 family protein
VRFEWDERKAAVNRAKHGIAFAEALTAFDDPFALVAPDAAHSIPQEERRWLIGEPDSGVLVVVLTIRHPGNVHRITSARPANRKERERYADSKELPL